MEVLNTTSPVVQPANPIELPKKTEPSASAKMAGGGAAGLPCKDKSNGFSGCGRFAQACAGNVFYRSFAGGFWKWGWLFVRLGEAVF